MAYKTPAWMRKAGKNPKGGLNAKGRASYKGGTLKAPVKSGDNPRRASFLARMGNMRGPEYKNGKPTRKNLALNDKEFFFDYLKKEIKEKRKMGHITTLI